MKEPYDWDEYAQNFFPKAEELAKKASEAEEAGEKEKASELYLYVTHFSPVLDSTYVPIGEALLFTVSLASQTQGLRSRNTPGRRERKSSTKVAREFPSSHLVSHNIILNPLPPACPPTQSAKSKSPTNTPSKAKAT